MSELIREQSFLKSELGLGLGELGLETLPTEGAESVFSHGNSDSSSVCSGHTGRKAKGQSKKLYRASVALTPTPPVRAGTGQPVESSEEFADSKPEVEHKLEKVPLMPSVDEIQKAVEQEELQQVIREVRKEWLRPGMFELGLLKPKDKAGCNCCPWRFSLPSPAKASYCSCAVPESSEHVTRCWSHSCGYVQRSGCFFSGSG